MNHRYDLSSLEWKLIGVTPYLWKLSDLAQIADNPGMEVPAIPARVPGSVQQALRAAEVLPDWNEGLNAYACEWVENRHWIFQASLPDGWFQEQGKYRLNCLGLDYSGWVYLNGKEAARFEGAHLPYLIELSPFLKPDGNLLQIIFDLPPRWLGQFGYTSQMTDWKPRYYYTWDWTSRLVQTGIWDELYLERQDQPQLLELNCLSEVKPSGGAGLRIQGEVGAADGLMLRLSLLDGQTCLKDQLVSPAEFQEGLNWENLAVKRWFPNGLGEQPLYSFVCCLENSAGERLDEQRRAVGFKRADWQLCAGSPPGADPWLCVINDRAVFLQGVNWTPIRPNFADVSDEDYRLRLTAYREMGCNILRVWGGGFLEKEIFYRLCDELGLLVWQEFPLSSSGVENWPPEDKASIQALAEIALSFVVRRRGHVSLLMWGGGNELQGDLEGGKTGVGRPVTLAHPLIRRFAEITAAYDPQRRFVASSSSGPRFSADPSDFGKGLHWDVHGPWKADPDLARWDAYWQDMDALFHSEVGAPGASPAEVIRKFSGGLPLTPGTAQNPLWRRTSWWIEWPLFVSEMGREPTSLEEFVDWNQQRQADALVIVARRLKSKFPRCGGVIFWMGHDSFPCTANTSILDFDGQPKPAALALAEIFKSPAGSGSGKTG